MMKKWMKVGKGALSFMMALCIMCSLASCANSSEYSARDTVNLFIAASLTSSVDEIIKEFNKEHPEIEVLVNSDSSGKLKNQIEEGFDCDIFFSASTREVDELVRAGLIEDRDVTKILENNLAVIGFKKSELSISSLKDIQSVSSIALPYASVPSGFYARRALIADGIISGDAQDKKSVRAITGAQVSEALAGVTISEQANASTTITAIAEQSTEIGLAYTSDVNRNENTKVLYKIPNDLTGDIVYPMAKIKIGAKAGVEHLENINILYEFLRSDKAKAIYERYGFTPR